MIRVIWKPQRCGCPVPRDGYRRLLNGIRISAVQPSATTRPPLSNSAFHESSPRMPNCPELLMPLPPPRRGPLPRLADPLPLDRENPVLPSAFTIESACTP